MKSLFSAARPFVLILGLCVTGIVPAMATDPVHIIVNGTQISTSQIDQRARLLKLTNRKLKDTAKQVARDELIHEILFKEVIQRANIVVSNEDVEAAYASIAKRVKLTPRGLSGALRQSGVLPETMQERLRVQIGWRRLKTTLRRLEEAFNEQDIPTALRNTQERPRTIKYRIVPHRTGEGLSHRLNRYAAR